MTEEESYRKVQLHGGSYYRMTLPPRFVNETTDYVKRTLRSDSDEYIRILGDEDEEEKDENGTGKKGTEVVEELAVWETENYLIMGPPIDEFDVVTEEEDVLLARRQPGDTNQKTKFELPKGISRLTHTEPDHEDKPMLERYIEKVLEGLIMSGAENIEVGNISRWESIKYDLGDAFGVQEGKGVDVEMDLKNLDNSRIRIGEGIDLDKLVSKVEQFLGSNLLRPLSEAGGTEDPETKNRTTFTYISSRVARKNSADKLDRSFSLAIRRSGEKFFDLRMNEYPREFAALYIAKYLESSVDLSKRLIDALRYLETSTEFPQSVVLSFESKLDDILTHGSSYETQLANSAKDAYDLDVGPSDYRNQLTTYQDRIERLDKIRYKSRISADDDDWHDWHSTISENDDLNGKDFGVSIGEICTLTERLVRIPRSITLAGIAAREVQDVQNLEFKPKEEGTDGSDS